MKQVLKNTVKDYVESQQLSNGQLQGLTKIMNDKHDNQKRKNFSQVRAIATVLVLSLALGMFWSFGVNNQTDVSRLIAEEVSYNHLKMKPMEVSSTSLSEVCAYFSKLEFSLSPSQFVANNNLQLIGGRYCSIQGEAAAQLRMRDQVTGEIQLVYQAPYDKELFRELPKLREGQDPIRHFVNGIGVDVWVEKGILFARSFDQ